MVTDPRPTNPRPPNGTATSRGPGRRTPPTAQPVPAGSPGPSPGRDESGRSAPTVEERGELHPHPLSNDLTDESLPSRTPQEQIEEESGVGPGARRMLKVGGAILVFLIAGALIGSALLFGARWEMIAVGVGLIVLYGILLGAPVLLAAGVKVAQDESVRDDRTAQSNARNHRRFARR